MRKFHHHKVLNIVIGIIAYAQLTLIICGSIALMIDILKMERQQALEYMVSIYKLNTITNG